MHIELTTSPTLEDAKAISQGIINFNHKLIPDLEPIEAEIRFSIFAKDDAGEVVGGIRASCYWNTLHIELLWLSEYCRSQGVGRQMLGMAEAFAREHRYEIALVETASWQAKPFYEKCGYTHYATIEDRPKGYASYQLKKAIGS